MRLANWQNPILKRLHQFRQARRHAVTCALLPACRPLSAFPDRCDFASSTELLEDRTLLSVMQLGTGVSNADDTVSTISGFNIASGLDRLLVVYAADTSNGNQPFSGVTFDGNALTRAVGALDGIGTSEIWYYVVPGTAALTGDIVVSGPGINTLDSEPAFVGATVYAGVDPANPINDQVSSARNSATASSLTVDSATEDLVVDFITVFDFDPIPGAGQNQNHEEDNIDEGGFRVAWFATTDEVGASTVDMSWSWASATSYLHVAVNLNAAPLPDFGDAPDTAVGTGSGNYQTTITDNGPRHSIDTDLFLGANIDGEDGTLQNARAIADDAGGLTPDDENAVLYSHVDLLGTTGAAPTVTLLVTNNTSTQATLAGWIDYDNDGNFETAERATLNIPTNTVDGRFELTLPTVPDSFTGTTYARFRLSTDPAFTAEPTATGPADGGEVEDYTFSITAPSDGRVNDFQKISSTEGSLTVALNNDDRFGHSATSVGDLDGDGFSDLVVGLPGSDVGVDDDRGAVALLFLNQDGTVSSHQTISDSVGSFSGTLSDNDQFGSSVTAIGDLNSDGIVDIAVGAPFDDDEESDSGAVWVLFLNSDGTVRSHQKISNTTGSFTGTLSSGDQFGASVSTLGDLDGDGVTDIVVGASGDDDGGDLRGAAWVLLLNSDGTVKSHQKISDTAGSFAGILADGDRFGTSVTGIGDLNGDGFGDIVVGTPNNDDGNPGGNRGAVWMLFLDADGTVNGQRKISDTDGDFSGVLDDEDHFGTSVTHLGDLNGDGVVDIAVGATGDTDGGGIRGAVWLLSLTTDGTVSNFQKISDTAGNFTGVLDDADRFGSSVTNLGDLDGDGLTDLAVGASFDDDGGADRGAVYILNLAPPDTTPPTVTSIVRQTPSAQLTNGDSVTFRVTFSEDTAGVDATDFTLTGTAASGGVIGTPTSVAGSIVFDIQVTGLASNNGTLDLDFAAGQDITDLADNALTNTTPTSEETYVIDNTLPTVTSILRTSSNPTNADSLTYTVTFSESVSGVDVGDFTLVTSGTSGTIASVSSTAGTSVTVTVNSVSGDGTLGLNFDADASGGVTDDAGNVSTSDFTGEIYNIDNTRPSVVSIERDSTSPTNSNSLAFTVTFSESVTGIDTGDFALATSGTSGTVATVSATSGTSVTVTVNSASGDGTLGLNFDADASAGVSDAVGNVSTADFIGQSYLIDNTAPTVSITAVTPDPRIDAVSDIDIIFSEAVTGFALSNLTLSRAGGPNILASPAALTTTDNATFTLGSLDTLTDRPGNYQLVLTPGGSSIQDAAGNTLTATAAEAWTHEGIAIDLTGDGKLSVVSYLSSASGVDLSISVVDSEIVLTDSANVLDSTVGTSVSDHEVRVVAASVVSNEIVVSTGPGDDAIDGSAVTGLSLTATSGNGNDTLIGGSGIDTLNGDFGDDIILGRAGNDSLIGGDGNDTIHGGKGLDQLFGNGGNDEIYGGRGHDSIRGGDGLDRLLGGHGRDTIDGGANDDFIHGGAHRDSLRGSQGADTIAGGSGSDTIYGGDGDDRLHGNMGRDAINAGSGADFVAGNVGRDTLLGLAGNDTLLGGLQVDILIGGDDDDDLDGGSGADTVAGGSGNDQIADPSEIDESFSESDFPQLVDL